MNINCAKAHIELLKLGFKKHVSSYVCGDFEVIIESNEIYFSIVNGEEKTFDHWCQFIEHLINNYSWYFCGK